MSDQVFEYNAESIEKYEKEMDQKGKELRQKQKEKRDKAPEGYVQVIWTLNKKVNTGLSGSLASVTCSASHKRGREDCVVKPQIVQIESLMEWCQTNGFVQYSTELCKTFGLHIEMWAKPHDSRKVNQGKNNVLATYLHCDHASGFAPHTIVGKAVLIRRDSQTLKPIDFTFDACLRSLFCINDLMDSYPLDESFDDPNDMTGALELHAYTIRTCFKYYQVELGDTMRLHGFSGNSYEEDEDNYRSCSVEEIGKPPVLKGGVELVPGYTA